MKDSAETHSELGVKKESAERKRQRVLLVLLRRARWFYYSKHRACLLLVRLLVEQSAWDSSIHGILHSIQSSILFIQSFLCVKRSLTFSKFFSLAVLWQSNMPICILSSINIPQIQLVYKRLLDWIDHVARVGHPETNLEWTGLEVLGSIQRANSITKYYSLSLPDHWLCQSSVGDSKCFF
jgi:hypothetical protein